MKKHIINSSVFLLIASMFSSCALFFDGVTGRGTIVEQEIQVGGFTAIETTSSAGVVVERGEALKVILSDYENLIEYWDIEVINNALVIKTKPFTSMMNSKALVTVVMPGNLYNLSLAGSGSIKLESTFGELKKATIAGSGYIRSYENAVYENLDLTISGSGDIRMGGSAQSVKAITSGSGRMYLSELQTKQLNCVLSGSGNMYVYATEILKVLISGSGSVEYSGTPLLDTTITGSGRVKYKQ
jgi:hypothetical protein